MDGKPFFVVNQAVDPGLLQTLEHDIVPRLERDVPNQPNAEELEADPLLHRFTIVFDREGYSPDFFARMKAQRVACLSYRKRPGEDWPPEEFIPTNIRLPSGEQTTTLLAERGTRLSNGLWVRELRKLSEGGHQTPFIATDYRSVASCLASRMFARWSQENFFRYMRQNYNLDGLVDYGTGAIPETTRVVNPAHRLLDGMVRKKVALLNRKKAEFGAINLEGDIEPKKVEAFAQRKSELQEAIAESQIAVELSTAGLRKRVRELYPAEVFLRMCVDAGAPIALSSDAHRPQDVGADYAQALTLLEHVGVNELCVFQRRVRRLQTIGATVR